MIEYRNGNILEAGTAALVCTVNCVGVMGKGVALTFKNHFPGLFDAYRSACNGKRVEVGRVWAWVGSPEKPYVACLPTKRHWSNPSRLSWVLAGLGSLALFVEETGISSIALPALGCGNGGLDWERDVKPMVETFARCLPPDVLVAVYEPTPDK